MRSFRLRRPLRTSCWLALAFLLAAPARGADPVPVEPAELDRRPELVGREVVVDDRVKFFLETKRGQGYDHLVLKRTEVPFLLSARLRSARPPSEPSAVARGTLQLVDGRLVVAVSALEMLPGDLDRLDRETGRLRPDDFAGRRAWALWAERRGAELGDAKLAARGAELEADALWVEAARPGADALALADRAADRPVPRPIRDALYHRGFRLAGARATTPEALDDLAARIRAALPRSATPAPGIGPTPSDAGDPAAAYRTAADDERARMDRRLLADVVARALDLRVAADPARAGELAGDAARDLPDRPEVADRIRRSGLDAAERDVAGLRQAEVEDLARQFRDRGEEDRARRLLGTWLADRRKNRLSATDAEGRVLLAGSYEKLLGDRSAAGELLAEAYAIDPESRGVADAFLRLGFRKGAAGWYDPERAQPAAASPADPATRTAPTPAADRGGDSLRGLSRVEVQARMGGKPDRVVRSATQGVVTELWIYQAGRARQYVSFRIDSATTEPRATSAYTIAQ